MKHFLLWLPLLTLALTMASFTVLLGCLAKRKTSLVNFAVPTACVHRVEFVGCAPDSGEPPRCAKVEVDYQKGCEVVETAK
jgi:hypothetical protein